MDEKLTGSTRVANLTQRLTSAKVRTLEIFIHRLENIFNSAEQVPVPLANI